MKLRFILLFCTGLYVVANAQGGTWVWMNGNDTVNSVGSFGTQGVASASNTPPALYQSAYWTDKQGNFWIFGGVGQGGNSESSDLWKFNPTNNTWTWVKGTGTWNQLGVYGTLGVPSLNNSPGSRGWGSPAWVDTAGNFWLFGGDGYDAYGSGGCMNDLWRYDVGTNEWTWMGGYQNAFQPGSYGNLKQYHWSNLPPPRYEANSAWTDAGNSLWLFGGFSYSPYCCGSDSVYNDTWTYNIGTGNWAWMNGPQWGNNQGHYGTLNQEDSSNVPPPRGSYTHWKDNNNNFYIWAGINFIQDPSGFSYFPDYNDLWRFNLNTCNWTWVGGANTPNAPGNYGELCTAAAANGPAARFENRTVETNDCPPVLYTFGGLRGENTVTYIDTTYNDLWRLDLSTLEWKWISGSDTINSYGDYGYPGVQATSNMPPGRSGECMWLDNQNHIWVFGGWDVYNPHAANPFLNDMWEFLPDNSCIQTTVSNHSLFYQLSSNAICPGDSVILSVWGDSSVQINPANNVTWLNATQAVLRPDSTTSYSLSGFSPCGAKDTAGFTISLTSGTITIAAHPRAICPGDSSSICPISTFTTYRWNTGETTPCIRAGSTGSYWVTVTENGRCSAISNHVLLAEDIPSPVTVSVLSDTMTCINEGPYAWYLNGIIIPGASSATYIAQPTGSYTVQITDTNGCSYFSAPVYITGIASYPENKISVYPNPTNTSWQLTVDENLIGGQYEIFDVTGQVVAKSAIRSPQSKIQISAASGVYLLRIISGEAEYTMKLVKL